MTHADTIFANQVARLQIGGLAQFSECFANFLDLMLAKFCNNPGKHATGLCHAVAKSSDLRQAFLDSADTPEQAFSFLAATNLAVVQVNGHATDEIETRYGQRIADRLRELCNTITYDGNQPSYRQ